MDNTKYWLKLEKNFLQSKYIKIIKDMSNGHDYILFYLALMLESIDSVGHLKFTDLVPYNEQMLSSLTDVNIDVVRSAMKLFKELGMITILEDGTIFMPEVPKLTGKECDSAERVRLYRTKKKALQCNSDVTRGNVEETKSNDNIEKRREEKSRNREEQECSPERSKANASAPPPATGDPVDKKFSLPKRDGTLHFFAKEEIEKYERAYPALDVMGELWRMLNWLEANPKNAKMDIRSFAVRWLSKEQERSGRQPFYQKNPVQTRTNKKFSGEVTGDITERVFGGRKAMIQHQQPNFAPAFGVYPRNSHLVTITCGMHGPKTVLQMTGPDGAVHTGRCQDCQAESPVDDRVYYDRKAAEDERYRRLIEAANIPPLYRDYTFQSFRIVSDNLLHVASRCHEVLDGTLLFLTMVGTTGAGKTHLAVACVNEAINRGLSARYVKESEMFGEIKEAFDERGNSDRRVIRRFASYDLLVVDEISKAPHSAYNASALFDIIDDRYTSKRRTIFVGNITSEEMQLHFTDAMLSRMRQKGKAVQVVESDWRNHV